MTAPTLAWFCSRQRCVTLQDELGCPQPALQIWDGSSYPRPGASCSAPHLFPSLEEVWMRPTASPSSPCWYVPRSLLSLRQAVCLGRAGCGWQPLSSPSQSLLEVTAVRKPEPAFLREPRPVSNEAIKRLISFGRKTISFPRWISLPERLAGEAAASRLSQGSGFSPEVPVRQ